MLFNHILNIRIFYFSIFYLHPYPLGKYVPELAELIYDLNNASYNSDTYLNLKGFMVTISIPNLNA